jgi:glucan biosynthesis protein C
VQAQTINKSAIPARRWEIDWLRVLVVLLLVPYHAARIFDHDPFYVKNGQLTNAFDYWLVRAGDAFAMRLLLLLAGAATWFALRRRSGRQYAKERFLRLLIPFIWGVFMLAPPNAYFARRIHSGYAESFFQFYPRFFEVGPEGIFLDFEGGFTVAHLWFILILFILALVALPLFLYLRRASGQRLINMLAGLCTRPGGILLLAIPPAIADGLFELSEDPLFPILLLLIFFVYGYVMVADARFDQALRRHRRFALLCGPVLYAILGAMGANTGMPDWLDFAYYHLIFPWFTVVALLGYGKQYLGFTDGSRLSDRFLIYFGESGYAFYLLHLPILAFIGFYVVRWDALTELGTAASLLLKYLIIAVGTFLLTTAVYELLVRRNNVVRFLFGMGRRRKPQKAPVERPKAALP